MSTSCCYRCIIGADKLRSLGLEDYINNEAIEYWGGFGVDKIVMSPCSNGEVVSCYCFYPAEYNNLREDGWNISASPQQLVDTFPQLDERMKRLMLNAEDIKMWRRMPLLFYLGCELIQMLIHRAVYRHEPYPYWTKGKVCLLGDAGRLISFPPSDSGHATEIFSTSYDARPIPRLLHGLRRRRRSWLHFPS